MPTPAADNAPGTWSVGADENSGGSWPTHCHGADSILAVTAAHLYAFEVKGGLKFKIKAPIGSWDRASVGIEALDGKATVQMKFDFGAGGVAVLETQKAAAHAGNLHFVREVTGGAGG